jgi:hypothetical protein
MPREGQIYQVFPLGEDLASVACVYDGTSRRQLGNFLGLYGTPPRGGRAWYAVNGDCGDAADDQECEREILEAWER